VLYDRPGRRLARLTKHSCELRVGDVAAHVQLAAEASKPHAAPADAMIRRLLPVSALLLVVSVAAGCAAVPSAERYMVFESDEFT
jgi:hypothetical protein